MSTPLHIVRGQGTLPEGNGLEDQWLHVDEALRSPPTALDEMLQWMSLDARSSDHFKLDSELEAWSLFHVAGRQVVARLGSNSHIRSHDRRPAYFAHGRAYPADQAAAGLHFGRAALFSEPWPNQETRPFPPEQEAEVQGTIAVKQHRRLAVLLVAQLLRCVREDHVLVVSAPLESFRRGSELARVVSLARAVLPPSVRSGLAIRMFTARPGIFLNLGAQLIVCAESYVGDALNAGGGRVTVLDAEGSMQEGRPPTAEDAAYAKAILGLAVARPEPFVRCMELVGAHFKERDAGAELTQSLQLLYTVAQAETQGGMWDALLTSGNAQLWESAPARLTPVALLPPGHPIWQAASPEVLRGLALDPPKSNGKAWHELACRALRARKIWLDDALRERGAEELELLKWWGEGLVHTEFVAELSAGTSLARWERLGQLDAVIGLERETGRLVKRGVEGLAVLLNRQPRHAALFKSELLSGAIRTVDLLEHLGGPAGLQVVLVTWQAHLAQKRAPTELAAHVAWARSQEGSRELGALSQELAQKLDLPFEQRLELLDLAVLHGQSRTLPRVTGMGAAEYELAVQWALDRGRRLYKPRDFVTSGGQLHSELLLPWLHRLLQDAEFSAGLSVDALTRLLGQSWDDRVFHELAQRAVLDEGEVTDALIRVGRWRAWTLSTAVADVGQHDQLALEWMTSAAWDGERSASWSSWGRAVELLGAVRTEHLERLSSTGLRAKVPSYEEDQFFELAKGATELDSLVRLRQMASRAGIELGASELLKEAHQLPQGIDARVLELLDNTRPDPGPDLRLIRSMLDCRTLFPEEAVRAKVLDLFWGLLDSADPDLEPALKLLLNAGLGKPILENFLRNPDPYKRHLAPLDDWAKVARDLPLSLNARTPTWWSGEDKRRYRKLSALVGARFLSFTKGSLVNDLKTFRNDLDQHCVPDTLTRVEEQLTDKLIRGQAGRVATPHEQQMAASWFAEYPKVARFVHPYVEAEDAVWKSSVDALTLNCLGETEAAKLVRTLARGSAPKRSTEDSHLLTGACRLLHQRYRCLSDSARYTLHSAARLLRSQALSNARSLDATLPEVLVLMAELQGEPVSRILREHQHRSRQWRWATREEGWRRLLVSYQGRAAERQRVLATAFELFEFSCIETLLAEELHA